MDLGHWSIDIWKQSWLIAGKLKFGQGYERIQKGADL
jgi:hypothetical protein